MKPKIFSVSEANALVPKISHMVKEIMDIHERIKVITQDVKELFDIWGEGVYEHGNPDNKLYNEKLEERTSLFDALKGTIEEIREAGGVVKDLDVGLIDFYHELDGELVFLCWKYGENEITTWHSLQEGFSSRKALGIIQAKQE